MSTKHCLKSRAAHVFCATSLSTSSILVQVGLIVCALTMTMKPALYVAFSVGGATTSLA